MNRQKLIDTLHAQIDVNGHILGAAVGSGITAKYAEQGGADLLLALSAGKFRIMGRSSYASYFCYGSSNDIVMDMGIHELLPVVKETPVLFGLFASDPSISLYEYLKKIKNNGFAGIVNYPTLSLIDGNFRTALEEDGNSYLQEVESIRLAHYLDLFTLAFVTNESEAEQMLEAGADVICVHLGLTRGGRLGAKEYITIEEARRRASRIFSVCQMKKPEVIRMIYAGVASTPEDMLYLYKSTPCQGYIGGSTFDRIPIENGVYESVRTFKNSGVKEIDDLMEKAVRGGWNPRDYTAFVRQFIAEHYMDEIRLESLALVMHLSPSYLSTRFKKDTGQSFTDYLVAYRIEKAREMLRTGSENCRIVSEKAGYTDYVQFSKMFRKYTGMTPTQYRKENS